MWNGKSGKARHSQELPSKEVVVIDANEMLRTERIRKIKAQANIFFPNINKRLKTSRVMCIKNLKMIIALFAIVLHSKAEELVPPNEEKMPIPPEGKEWCMTFNDEFDGNSIDETHWEILGDEKRRGGWLLRENAKLNGQGHMDLLVTKTEKGYAGGGLCTAKKFKQKFGYFSCRAKLIQGSGKGYLNAFWLFAWSVHNVGNMGKDGTQIVVVGRNSKLSGHFQHALSWDGYEDSGMTEKKDIPAKNFEKQFHTFSLYWSEAEYVFYVDCKEAWRTNSGGVSQVPEFIYLTTEIVDHKMMDMLKPKLPDAFCVDYVRVYELKDKQKN